MFNRITPNTSDSDEDSDRRAPSSLASEVLSKKSAAESWYDVKSDTEQRSPQLRSANPLNQLQGSKANDQDHALLQSIHDIYGDSNPRDVETPVGTSTKASLVVNGQSDKEWTNPYWGANWKPATASSAQQFIPGSILIDDQGAIGGSQPLQKKTEPMDSVSPSNSLQLSHDQKPWTNPYWSTPAASNEKSTLEKKTDTSASTPSQLAEKENVVPKQDLSTSSTSHESKSQTQLPSVPTPWVNPYWKTQTQQSVPSTASWENPYWKEKKSDNPTVAKQKVDSWSKPDLNRSKSEVPTSSKQEGKSWENPYWKTNKGQTPVPEKKKDDVWTNPYWKENKAQQPTLATQQSKPWVNPYWKESKAPQQQQSNQPWVNPYWKNNGTFDRDLNGIVLNNVWQIDNISPSDHEVPPVPSFYQRIFPVVPPPSSFRSTAAAPESKENTLGKPSTPTQQPTAGVSRAAPHSSANGGEYDDFAFTIDAQGVAHYRPEEPTSPAPPNKAVSFAASHHSNSSPPPQQTNGIASFPLVSNIIVPQSSSNTLNYASNYSSSMVVTESEVYDLQQALRLLETNPNSVVVVEASERVPTGMANHQSVRPPVPAEPAVRAPQFPSPSIQRPSPRRPSPSDYPNGSLNRFTRAGPVVHI